MKAFALSLVVSIGFLLLSVRAVRRRVLREQAALLWLAVSLVMVFVSATLPLHLLDRMAELVGIAYAPDLILLLAVLFLVVLVFHLSLSLARLHEKHTALVQEFGILTATKVADDHDTPHESRRQEFENVEHLSPQPLADQRYERSDPSTLPGGADVKGSSTPA